MPATYTASFPGLLSVTRIWACAIADQFTEPVAAKASSGSDWRSKVEWRTIGSSSPFQAVASAKSVAMLPEARRSLIVFSRAACR